MDVLVTGTTGYAGATIADALLSAGFRVAGLARSEESAGKLGERGIAAVGDDIMEAGSVGAASRRGRGRGNFGSDDARRGAAGRADWTAVGWRGR